MSRAAVVAARVITLLSAACGQSEAEREENAMTAATPQRLQADGTIQLSEADQRSLGLEITAASEDDLPDVTLRLGRVHAPLGDQALIVSPVAGRIPSVPKVQLGAAVHAGDQLVEVVPVLSGAERVSLGIQGADMNGQIEAASRELTLHQADSARTRELAASNIVSQAKLQEAETAVQMTRAKLEALRRAKELQVSGEGGSIFLRTPVAGAVVSLEAQVGAVVHAGDVLARVLQTGPRWIDVLVPADDPSGDAYEVSAGRDWVPARLLARGAVVEDDGSRHDRVEVAADHAGAVLPGATASVRVARRGAKGIVLPEAALVPGFGTDTVFVQSSPGAFAARNVRVAARFGGRIRLTDSGIKPGDEVVTRGAMSLRGESVRSELRHTE